jgi:hypothetical protein
MLRAQQVSALIQGEVLSLPDACVRLADGRWPLTAEAKSAADTVRSDLLIVPVAVDFVAVLTQTCDLQRTTEEDAFCQVAPVLTVTEQMANEVARGWRPRYVAIPWFNASAVADLGRVTTVERSLLVDAQSVGRPGDPATRFHLAEMIGRHTSRAALPDSVSEAVRPILARMKSKNDKQSSEGRCVRLLASIRAEARPHFDAVPLDLTLLFVISEEDLPSLPASVEPDHANIDKLVLAGATAAADAVERATDALAARESWIALTEIWAREARIHSESSDDVSSVSAEVLNGEELSFARSRNAPELDLAYLSTRVA